MFCNRSTARRYLRDREFFIEDLPIRIPSIIEMIWWTGLAPWKFESPFPGSLISTFLILEVPGIQLGEVNALGSGPNVGFRNIKFSTRYS